jgi:hypothetical protein
MALVVLANFATTRFVTPPSGAGGLSFVVTASEGAKFPALSGGNYFYGVASNTAQTIFEVMKITAISTDTFTIVGGGRGADGSTPLTWNVGDLFYLPVTRLMLAEYKPLNCFASDTAVTATNATNILPTSDPFGGTVLSAAWDGSRWRIVSSHGEDVRVGFADNATKWNGAAKTVSVSAPSGGVDGDIWFMYS